MPLTFTLPHSWKLSPREAIALQKELASQILRKNGFKKIKVIAGVDCSLSKDEKKIHAGVILYEFPSLIEIRRVEATGPLDFPYVPGLLSFREIPTLIKAFEKLDKLPDLVLVDGQGLAHPRRLGIASHLGLILDRPTIGCAKSRLCGSFKGPGKKRGKWTPLMDKTERIGAVLRTRDGVNPIFVSVGHQITLKMAIRIVLQCDSGYRIPKPTREADFFVAKIKRA
jgi:deoxyribonuclease V